MPWTHNGLFGKHTDKIPWDKPRGIRTFPVLVGHSAARYTTLALIPIQYAMSIYLVFSGLMGWPILLVLPLPLASGTRICRQLPKYRPMIFLTMFGHLVVPPTPSSTVADLECYFVRDRGPKPFFWFWDERDHRHHRHPYRL